jgi:hypothetical protein
MVHVRSNPCLYLNRTIQKIGPELIYIDVTPVAGKGKNMLFFLEQQRHLLAVKAQHDFFKHSAIYWP